MENLIFKIVSFLTFIGLTLCQTIEFRTHEEKKNGSYIGNVLERSNLDRDELRFTLMQKGNAYESYFQIDEFSGNLTNSDRIDREELCEFTNTCEFLLEIAAQSIKNDGFFVVLRVLVIVEDINDHEPTFSETTKDLEISEEVVTGTVITFTGARDKDMSDLYSIQTHELVPKTPGDAIPFTISFSKNLDGSSNVMLKVSEHLNREVRDNYEFYIIAKDGGSPPLSGTLMVNVVITDTNDEYPQFSFKEYNVTIKEDIGVNMVFLKIQATDLDIGKNGEVRFSLSPRQQTENLQHFSIDAMSGDLKVIKSLDQNLNYFKLIVEASDLGDIPMINQTFVTVTVLDSGNNAPIIRINLLSQQNVSRISEYANIGAVVAHVAINDHDSGRNGEVDCSVLSDLFSLQRYDVNEYKVIVSNSLNRERNYAHNVSIRCQDKGVPPKSASASFIVHVDDENDNPPTFRQQRYFANIDENNDIGDRIATVTAFDLDLSGSNNSKIRYSIQQTPDNYAFVNPTTGDVMANKVFDKESKAGRGFSITVIAVDNGSPALTGTTTVLVTINDLNDNKPEFDQANFRFWTKENQPADTVVGRVTSNDTDSGNNAKTRYSLKVVGSVSVPFVVFTDGYIKTDRELDRETQSEYTFEVIAMDEGDVTLYSTAAVTIFVMDVNDHEPQIKLPTNGNDTVNVPYMTPPKTTVYNVIAVDLDEPGTDNSKLTYSISTMNKTNFFAIDSTTGAISLVAQISSADFIGRIYILKITVRDNNQLSEPATSILRVRITVDNGTYGESTEEESKNFVIVVAVATVTILISAGILVTICIIRRLDRKKKAKSSNNQKVLAENMYSKNNDEVDNIFPLPMDTNFMEKKKKEVSFSIDENGVENHQILSGVEGQCHDNFDNILLEPPPQYQQLDLPKGKLDDSHSDMSGESAGDSGKGGSDDDLQLASLSYRDDIGRNQERWDHRRSKSPGVHQMTSFQPRFQNQPQPSTMPLSQKIIPFSFKKTQSYPGQQITNTYPGVQMNNLSPTTSSYSVPMYYDDDSRSSSGFHSSMDSNSNLNIQNNGRKVNLNGFRGNSDCVV